MKFLSKKYQVVIVFYLITSILDIQKTQAQADSINKNPVFSLQASYIGDVMNNLSGGIKQGTSYLGMANIRISFSTENARWWKGGEFFINAANTHGATPTADYVGDFQGVSNIEAGELSYFHELWYKQTIGKFTGVLGLQDLNTELVSSEYASLFLNGSFGTHSNIADNVPTPIFPLTAFGLQLQYAFSESIAAKIIIFDGFPDDFENNPHNLNWHLGKEDGLLNFYEVSFNHSLLPKYDGTYKIGSYSHIHFTEDEPNNRKLFDNYGYYFVGDQTIYQTKNSGKISLFAQASISPKEKNENWYYIGAGISVQGLFTNRPLDEFGIAVADAGFQQKNNETTIELTYKTQLNKLISLQPDFQYVINPAGSSEKLKNAFVASIRFGINLQNF